MADPVWLRPLEAALNARVAESETAQAALAEVAGRRFGVQVRGLPWMIGLHAAADRLELELDPQPPPEAWAAGSLVAMNALAAGRGESLIREGQVELHGDGEVAERFWELLQAVGPEWEEELARLIGDAPAHQLARGARAAAGWAGRSAETLGRNLVEYLQEESRDLAGRGEQHGFFEAVDRLRDDTERLEARIARLERRREEPDS